MSGARWLVWEMDGVKWMAWDEGDEWCMVVRDEWWGINGERWAWWEMNVYIYEALCEMSERSSVRCVCVYVRCCVRWMRWVVWNCGERWVMSDDWIKISGVRTATPNTVYRHTASCQTRMPGRHQRNMFASPILAQLPRTQFTRSKAPNPHVSKTSAQNFRISYWHIGTATPSDVYTQQGAKPECQEHINAKISQLLLAQLSRATFTHSKAPNPHARKTSKQNFRSDQARRNPFLEALSIPVDTAGTAPATAHTPPTTTRTPF